MFKLEPKTHNRNTKIKIPLIFNNIIECLILIASLIPTKLIRSKVIIGIDSFNFRQKKWCPKLYKYAYDNEVVPPWYIFPGD